MSYKENSFNEDGVPVEYLEELRQLMSDFNLPFITINIHNKEKHDAPLLIICGKIEAVINSILADIFFARMDEGGYLLGSLESNLDSLLTLSSYLRLKHEKNKLSKVLNKIKDTKEEPIPVPKVFEQEFRKAWEATENGSDKDGKI